MHTAGKNNYMLWLKNHLPCQAHNHKSLCALRQDLQASGLGMPWCQALRDVLVRSHNPVLSKDGRQMRPLTTS